MSDRDVPCVRAADFRYDNLDISLQRAPIRSFAASQLDRLALEPGDVIVEKSGGGDNQPVGRSVLYRDDKPAVCSNFTARLRVRPDVLPDFLVYVLAAMYASGVTAKFIKQTTGIQNLDIDAWLSEEVPLPPLDEQRRIANYLDDQTTRINQAIELRSLQLALIGERFRSWCNEALVFDSYVPLRRLLRDAAVGIVVRPSDWYSEEPDAVPALRGLDVTEFSIAEKGQIHISSEGHAFHRRSQLREGDVVVVRTGDAGAAAVVGPDCSGWNAIDLLVLRTDHNYVPEFLVLVLNAARWTQQVGASSAGSIQQHFGLESARALSVPLPSLDQQVQVLRDFRGRRRELLEAQTQLGRSIALLVERQRALISAAVAGEPDEVMSPAGLEMA